MPAKIPATIVTGFLGAGKTTLIRHLLENAEGRRIALVINEFGDLGVDGEIVKGCGIEGCGDDEVVELSNGCICCAVADDFIPALEKLLALDPVPDHIVIETSGLALPQPLVRAFGWPAVRTRVTVDGVIAVVDGPAAAEGRFAADLAAVEAQRAADDNLDHMTPLAELFEDQLASADMVLVNKADLMDDAAMAGLSARIAAKARAGVQVRPTTSGSVPPAVLLGLCIGAEDDLDTRAEVHHRHHDDHHHHDDDHDHHHDDDHHHHDHDHHHHHHDHGHDAFESFVVEIGELADAAELSARVTAAIAGHGLLRVKGFAAVTGKPMRLVLQAVGPRVDTHFDRPFAPGETRAGRLVVIGEAGIDRDAVAETLSAPASAPAEAAAG